MIEGKVEEHDKKVSKKRPRGYERRFRGRDFTGEGADIIIEGNADGKRKKIKPWERFLRKGKYPAALDEVLKNKILPDTITLLVALRHRSALRTALSGRDEVSLQPIFTWVCTHISSPRYVHVCVDIGIQILDLYSSHMGESPDIDRLMQRLHQGVRHQVEMSQQSWKTQGMLEMILQSDG